MAYNNKPEKSKAKLYWTIGIILGATARKKDTQRAGIATAGMVLSIISVVIAIIVTVACAAMIGIGLSALS